MSVAERVDARTTRHPAPEQRRADILRTAAGLFDRHGYVETTMQDIADELNISKPTLYKHAKSKSEILQMIINDWIDRSDANLEAALQHPKIEERIPMLVRQWTEHAAANRAHLQVFLSDEQDMPPRAIRRYREWSRKVYRTFRQLIVEAQEAGFYRADIDATVATFSILGFILLLPRWMKTEARLEPDDVAQEFLRMLGGGLEAPAGARKGGKNG